MLALPFAVTVTGMCTGNTDISEDVDCADGDGSDAANTQNKGSGQAGNDAATCCEALPGKCGWHVAMTNHY